MAITTSTTTRNKWIRTPPRSKPNPKPQNKNNNPHDPKHVNLPFAHANVNLITSAWELFSRERIKRTIMDSARALGATV